MHKLFNKFITKFATFLKIFYLVIIISFISVVDCFHNKITFAYEIQNQNQKDLLILYQTAMRHNRNLELGKSQQQLALEIIENYLKSMLVVYRIDEKQQLISYYDNIINTKKISNLNAIKSKKGVLLWYIKNAKDTLQTKLHNIRHLTHDDFTEKNLQYFDLNQLITDTNNNSLFTYSTYTVYLNNQLIKERQKINKHVMEYEEYVRKLKLFQQSQKKDKNKAKPDANDNIYAEFANKDKNDIQVELNKLKLNAMEAYADYFIAKSKLLFKNYRLNYYQIHDINKYLVEQ